MATWSPGKNWICGYAVDAWFTFGSITLQTIGSARSRQNTCAEAGSATPERMTFAGAAGVVPGAAAVARETAARPATTPTAAHHRGAHQAVATSLLHERTEQHH
jgi:hypothetical protein